MSYARTMLRWSSAAAAWASRWKRARYDESCHAVLRQHFDRHAALHQHVFAQIHPAHPAGAQMIQQLVLAQEEALVAAFQQPVGLPAGDEFGLDEAIGDDVGVGDGVAAGFAFQIEQKLAEPILLHQPAAPHEVKKSIYLQLAHTCPVPPGSRSLAAFIIPRGRR